MSSVAIFLAGKTPQYIPSNIVPADYAGRNDVVIDPDISQVASLALKYWKLSGGIVVAMTAQEQAAVDAAITAQALSDERSGALADFASTDDEGAILRAMGAVLMDEVNTIREWFVSFQAATAAATSLANLQTRIAALPNMPDRTMAQFKTAITTKINSGSVDA